MKSLRSLLAAGAMFCASLSPTHADQMWVTWAGLATGYDNAGYFGGGYLSGAAFTSRYLFETSGTGSRSDTGTFVDRVYGGANYANTNPALFASLTINGYTFSFTPSIYGEAAVYNDGAFSEVRSIAYGASVTERMSNWAQGSIPSVPVTLETPFVTSVSGLDPTVANFFVFGGTDLSFANNSVTVAAAIPEPETYALMLAGLGMLAFARRRAARRSA